MIASSSVAADDWLAEFPPPRSLPLDQEALRIYERAYAIGLEIETNPSDPPITFSAVVLALLTGEDETSRWFGREASTYGPAADRVATDKGKELAGLPTSAPAPGRPSTLRLSSDKQLLTASARSVLETAEEWAMRVGGSDIGVRQLVATYVINPPAAHRKQMRDWGFQETPWRQAFFAWVAPRYTAEAWNDASQRAAITKQVGSFEKTVVKGEDLAFLGDADEPTRQVLARAAGFHLQRPDPWLRLQTLTFALVEQARADPVVRQAITPVWKAIEPAPPQYLAALDDYVGSAPPLAAEASFDALNISPRVLNCLETARELTLASRREHIGVLQLAGALVSQRVDNDEELSRLGLDAPALRRALIEYATAHNQNAEVWREALGEEEAAPTGRPVDLNSDEPEAVIRMDAEWKTDPLGIRPDVHAFAALLASRSLEPPLSIGLFGPWGSGKTTFLKRLRRVVDQRADEARTVLAVGATTPYVGNVVHVEFNAWHFAEDALVSSLVDTIARAIQEALGNSEEPVGDPLLAMRARTAESASRALEDAKRRQDEARGEVEQKARALAESEDRARTALVGVRSAMHAVWAAAVESAKKSPVVRESAVLDKIGGAVDSAEALQQRIASIRSRSAPMLHELGWKHTLLFAFLVLALPPLMAWLVKDALGLDGVAQSLATVAAALSTATLWLRAAGEAASKVDRAVAEVARRYDEELQKNQPLQQARRALAAADASAASAAQAVTAAEQALQEAQAAVAAASLPAQMLALVARRSAEATYAQELTSVSTARGDLQHLSKLMRDQAAAPPSAGAGLNGVPRGIDRVILYVDDLDRCRPEQVVRVLQLVHMLLSFELFVVVVAVDARWVEESLKTNYAWLADGGGAVSATAGENGNGSPVTPQDYLEKIFQISFWLEPLTAGRAAAYLKSLVRQRRMPEATAGAARPISGTGLEYAGRIDVEPTELDYMRALAAYVGPSPRRVKRLVNAYRLLKARMSDAQLASFITDRRTDEGEVRSGPYQLVIGLLVIGTGAPRSGAHILKNLAERDPRDAFDQVIDDFRERQHPDWTVAARVLETLLRTQKARDIAELRGWARRVARFLLQGPSDVVSSWARPNEAVDS